MAGRHRNQKPGYFARRFPIFSKHPGAVIGGTVAWLGLSTVLGTVAELFAAPLYKFLQGPSEHRLAYVHKRYKESLVQSRYQKEGEPADRGGDARDERRDSPLFPPPRIVERSAEETRAPRSPAEGSRTRTAPPRLDTDVSPGAEAPSIPPPSRGRPAGADGVNLV